jgi:hypothetical protein
MVPFIVAGIAVVLLALVWAFRADEITVGGSLAYDDGDGEPELYEKLGILANNTNQQVTKIKVSVGTGEEAIPLGECTTPGWIILQNLSETNFVNVKTGTGGVICGKMLPGEIYGPVRLGSGMQAPYWIADTAACKCRGLVINT